jgi:hypothetical protein
LHLTLTSVREAAATNVCSDYATSRRAKVGGYVGANAYDGEAT